MLIQKPKIPNLLQRVQWILNPVEYMEGNAKLYPDIFEVKIVGYGGSLVFVNHPEAIQEILTNDRNKLSAPGKFNAFLKPFIGSHSMVTMGAERHRKRRKLLMPAFHGDRMSNYGQLIVKLTEKVINNLPINKPFSARKAMQEITLQIILEVVFGLQEGKLYQELRNFSDLLGNLFESPLSSSIVFFSFLQKDLGAWSPWGNFLRQKQKIDELLYAEIAQRRFQEDCCGRTDILSLLMSARDEEGNPMSDQEIRDELIALLLAGYENTATALAWELYWTHRIPEVKTKILEELIGIRR